MAEIDSLDIQIGASASKANRAIDSLIEKLGDLSGALDFGNISGIEKQTSKFNDFQKTIGNISDGMKSLRESMGGMSSSADSGVGQIAKTITRLANAGDKSTQVASSLPKIGNALKKMTNDIAGVGNVDSDVNKLVSSIARLANSGEKSAVAAKELPELGTALKSITDGMKGLDGISDSTNTFVQTVAQLANSGDKAGKAAAGLGELSQRTLDFFNAMKNAPQISENTIRMAQAMAQLSAAGGRASSVGAKISASMKPLNSVFTSISKAAEKMSRVLRNALKGLGTIVGGAFSKIGQIGLKASNAMKKVAGDMVAAFSRITHSSKGLKTASSNLGTLLKTIIGFKGIQGILNFGKSALEFGSDITEIENVVDTAFGNMRQHAYDFASKAKEQFGLSELAAKQYSGTMMAMLKSSGVMQREAAEMSTTLAGLAGDIASFYNIETDEAFYKLRSAISGETEPMKQLGVNMNIVNLEAFAMSRGINKAYRDMTLAEQATLRYNYILAKTTDAQGDFAKTAGTYANQIRLLKLNFQSLSGVIGQGLIAGILPVIKALNALMAKLMQAATVFKNFMYTLMGKKIESTTSGIVNDLTGIGDASGSLNDLGNAAEEAGNKLKKKLFTLPFDELNILSDESSGLSDAIGDIGDIGGIGFDDSFLDTDSETPINEWAKRIRDAFLAQDWEELGKTIAELINKGLRKIYDAIIEITPKVEQALKDFAAVFNAFVEYLDWDLLGRTIGAGVNLITTSINALLGDNGIDFQNLGKKLSAGFRGMIGEINWTGLGNAIGNWLMVAWRIADGFISDMWRVSAETMRNGWQELGIAVGKAVNGVFDRIDFKQIARVLTQGFRGILEAIASALETIKFDVIAEKINAGLQVLADGLAWEHIGEQVTRLSAAISKAFNDLLGLDFGLIGEAIGNGITSIIRAFNQLTGEDGINFELLGANIADGLRSLFASIPWEELGNALGNGFMLGWRILNGFISGMAQESDAGLTGWAELGISIGNAINGIFQKIDFGAIGEFLSNAFNGLIDIIRNFIETVDWPGIAANLTQGLNNFIHGVDWAGAGATLGDFVMKLLRVFWEVVQNTDWESLGRGIGEFLSNIDWRGIIGQVFDILWTVFSECISGLFDTKAGKVIIAFTAGLTAITGVFKLVDIAINAYEWITRAAVTLSGLKGLIMDKVVPGVSDAISFIAGEGGLFSKIVTGAKNAFSGAGILTKIGSVIFSPHGLLIAGVIAGVALIVANWDKIKKVAKNLWENVLVPFGNFIKDVFTKVWEDYLSPALSYITETIIPPLMDILSALWNKILVPLGKFIADVLGPVFKALGEIIKFLVDVVVVPAAKVLTDVFGAAFETVADIVNDLGDVLGGIIDFITGVFTGNWEKAWNGVVGIFKGVFNLIPSIAEGVINAAIKVVNGIIGGINNVINIIPGDFIPNIPTIPSVSLPRFAAGGFPEDGLFYANHTELVGQFSNGKTAVANNEQIIAGIEEAAYRGFLRAQAETSPYLADIAENTRRTADKDMSVRIGDRDIVTAYDRGKTRQGYSFAD